MESIVDFVGDRAVREELDLLFLPSKISVRTGLRLEPVPDLSLLQTSLPLPSCPSSPGEPSRSCVSKFTAQILEIYCFFLTLAFTRSDADCFQVREVPVILLCPPKRSAPPLESIEVRYMLTFTVSSRVDFVQDLYLKELKVYKPAPKVPCPASSTIPQPQHSLTTLYLFLGRQ